MRTNYGIIEEEYVKKSLDYAVAKAKAGNHLDICSDRARTDTAKFITAFTGKLGEFAVYQYYKQIESSYTTMPDVKVWDQRVDTRGDGGVDLLFCVNGKTTKIDIKTVDDTAKYLCYETNKTNPEYLVADVYVLVKVNYKQLYEYKKNKKEAPIEELVRICSGYDYCYQICGFLTKGRFVAECESEEHCLIVGDNAPTWMRQDNYCWTIDDLDKNYKIDWFDSFYEVKRLYNM